MNLTDFFISSAHAQAGGAAPQGGGMTSMLLMFPLLFLVMYFLTIRPQMKKQKEHKAMLEALNKGDEVLTNGGIAGRVVAIGDQFISVEIADNTVIRVQKGALAMVLPKGTLAKAA